MVIFPTRLATHDTPSAPMLVLSMQGESSVIEAERQHPSGIQLPEIATGPQCLETSWILHPSRREKSANMKRGLIPLRDDKARFPSAP